MEAEGSKLELFLKERAKLIDRLTELQETKDTEYILDITEDPFGALNYIKKFSNLSIPDSISVFIGKHLYAITNFDPESGSINDLTERVLDVMNYLILLVLYNKMESNDE